MKSARKTRDTTSTASQLNIIDVDNISSDEDLGQEMSILSDVARGDDNFSNSRRTLAYTTFPEVYATIRKYKCCSILTDPEVTWVH